MIGKLVRKIWRVLPEGIRLKAVRITQEKFTASVAAIITNENNEVLILNHVLRPYSEWGLPGGFINSGEQPHDAIKRELMEETGIELTDLRLFRVRVIKLHIEMLFSARAVGIAEVKSREILEVGWFRSGNFPAKMSLAQKVLIEKVLKGEV